MESIQAGLETFVDSPGDLLAIGSIIALSLAGILFLIDARLSGMKQAFTDMREENARVHDEIKDDVVQLRDEQRQALAAHMSSPAHNRRSTDAH